MSTEEKVVVKKSARRFTTRDLVTLGILSALILVVTFVGKLPLNIFPPTVVFSDASASLFLGILFVLMAARVSKVGIYTIHGVLFGLLYQVMFGAPTFSILTLVAGVLADLIAWRVKGGYRNPWVVIGAFVLIRVAYVIGKTLPLWLWADVYIAQQIAEGCSPEVAATHLRGVTGWMGALFVVVNLVAAIVGGLIGYRILRKHFEKAGVV